MKRNRIPFLSALAVLHILLLVACSPRSGQPQEGSEVVAPNQVVDFDTLFKENCSGCHGADGGGGASIPLANPVYLAVVDKNAMRKIVANGVRGTSMPAFAQSAGGLLTDEQIDAITRGMFSRWGRKDILNGSTAPFYAASTPGNAERGEIVFGTYCAACHGSKAQGGPKGSAIANDSFLALVSDQGLRTIVITGRPDLGAPDWRGNVPGKPMSDQEITDVVAWLASRRVASPGQPYSASNYGQHLEK
jgi:cytochrome c oxidase cbb3-type subunit 3